MSSLIGCRVLSLTGIMGASLAAILGCSGSAVSQVRTGTPQEAAAKAFEIYDADSDGKLADDELQKCLSIASALDRIDSNRDSAVDLAEMEARFAAHDELADLVGFDIRITSKQEPLVGATITYTPEPFMGEGKQNYVGTSTDGGNCYVVGQEVEFPGVPIGFYQVRIVHQASGVDVTRGCEVAGDAPTANRMEFDVAVEQTSQRRRS
jgi:hypothetical protein